MNKLYSQTLGDGPQLVMLHGWGMNAAIWRDLARELAVKYRVTLVELPGHGRSDWNGESAIEQWVDACLEAAPREAIWLGWSLGGLISLKAALAAPERIQALLLISTNPKFVRDAAWPHGVDDAVLSDFGASLVADQDKTLQRFLALQVRGANDAAVTLRSLRKNMKAVPASHIEALKAGLGFLRQTDLREHLSELSCPVTWLLGEKDALVPTSLMDDLHGGVSRDLDLRMALGAGHAPFLSHKDLVHQWIDGFISENLMAMVGVS